MLLINTRVACSAFSILTCSASAAARSASAVALRIVAFRVTIPITAATNPPPSK